MATNIANATDEILSALKVKWDASAQATAGTAYLPQMVFEANERDLKPHPSTTGNVWARAIVRHAPAGAKATALGVTGGAGVAANAKGRFRRTGFLFLQVFFPNESGESWQRSRALATLAQSAYEGIPSKNVTFVSASVSEGGQDGSFYVCRMNMAFYWDEIK